MKQLLLPTIAAVLVVGRGEQQKSIPQTEIKQDSATANATGISIGNDSWGKITSHNAEFYASNDVPKDQIDLTKKWYEIATKAWGNYGPTEFWIVGNSVHEAIKLTDKYCNFRIKKGQNVSKIDCINNHSFVDYASNGGAGLSTFRNNWDDWSGFVIGISSKPPPQEDDYKVIILHEYFHVYQHAHIYSKDEPERNSRNRKNPWWPEGGAEYMAQLLYSKQKGVQPSYLKSVMKSKLKSLNMLGDNESIKNIPYDDQRTYIAYDLGAWFIAFLIHKTNEETYRVKFFKDLNEKGFEDAFVNSFGSSSKDLLREFHETFLRLSVDEKLKIIPLKAVAEYLGVYTLNYTNGYLNFNISEDGSVIVESSLGDKANGSWEVEGEYLFSNAIFKKNNTIIKAKININTYELNELTMNGNPAPLRKANPDGVFLIKKIN